MAVGEAINLGSGKEHKVIDLANTVNALTGNEAWMKYIVRRDRDVKHRLLSSIKKPFHAVCAPHEDALIIITVYRPDLNRWIPNYKTRRR